MDQVSERVFVETGRRGANHGYVVSDEGVILIDTPFKPTDALRLRDAIEQQHRVIRFIVDTEPHLDHWTGNAYFDAPVIAHAGVRERILGFDHEEQVARIAALGPDEPPFAASYVARAPTVTFQDELVLHHGDRTVRVLHMPGHTKYQAAVIIEEEGVVFTSDNLFSGVQTWLQEADPAVLLQTLERLKSLGMPILVPGHGAVCGPERLDEQAAYVREWVDYVRDAVDRGLTREAAIASLTAMTGRYPMDVEQAALEPKVMGLNVANLYDYVTGAGAQAS